VRVAGRGYRDGVRNLEVMVESLSGGSRPEIQEEGRVIELLEAFANLSRVLQLTCLSSIGPNRKLPK